MTPHEKKLLYNMKREIERLKERREIDWPTEYEKLKELHATTTTLMLHKVPSKIKHDFKAACIRNETTMKQQIIFFMQRYAEHEDLNNPA